MPGPKLTEAIVLDLMRDRLAKPGNGGSGEYAFLTHVRNDAAFGATRTFDAVAVNLWPSRGLGIDVFEVKVSRSDWLRELKDPAKAEAACQIGDRFTMVAPAGVIKDGELPTTWGQWDVLGDGTDEKPWKIRSKVQAPWLRSGPTKDLPISRGLLVSMLRCCPDVVPGGRVVSASERAVQQSRAEGQQAGIEVGRQQGLREAGRGTDDLKGWHLLRDALLEAGLPHFQADGWSLHREAALIARALAAGKVDERLGHVRDMLARALSQLDEAS